MNLSGCLPTEVRAVSKISAPLSENIEQPVRTFSIRARHYAIETLARWQRELQERGYVRVIEGTKGGRPRDVHPANMDRALTAIQNAQAVINTTGQRYLVTCADGAMPANLRQAGGVYRNLCHRAGTQSHSARYAFASERLQAYRDQGYSEREARRNIPGSRARRRPGTLYRECLCGRCLRCVLRRIVIFPDLCASHSVVRARSERSFRQGRTCRRLA